MFDDALVGTVLAGYRIDALIGRGGMSRVYRAHQLALQRNVALKVLPNEFAVDRDYRERFLRECRMAASIEHPNILPIYDAGEADGRLFIAMRLVEGTDLKELIRREGGFSADRSSLVLRQAAMALDAAHAIGLVHRDIKPANLLIAGDHLYLADFGVAKLETSATHVTQIGVFVGTIDYAAPEQLRNERVDGRTDLYSLGCVFYECLTGRPPFERPTDVDVLQAQLTELPPSVRDRKPELPSSVDSVINTAMAKDPGSRYRTGASFAEAARLALAVRMSQSRSTVIEHLEMPQTAIGPTQALGDQWSGEYREALSETSGKPSPRRTRVAILAVAGVLLIAGISVGAARSGALSGLTPIGQRASSAGVDQGGPTPTPTPPTPPTTSPPSTTPPFAGRPVTLKPEQVIMPPGEFPFRGYTINRDVALFGGWEREFSSSNLDYYYIKVTVYIYGPSTSGASQLARASCDITFTGNAPIVSEVTAEVIADGAKACQYHFVNNVADWVEYITASRNVLISVAGEARSFQTSNAAAMGQMITIAGQQIAIIDRVAPR